MILLIGFATFAATLLGGLFALRFKDQLHFILGFSAGAIIGVAFFDLLPEAIELGGEHFTTPVLTSVVALGFLIYLLVDRLISLHGMHEGSDDSHSGNRHRGRFGAGSLALHSFLDGTAIGLAFQVSSAVGVIVTTAVLVHDFSDGMNTVNLILKNQGSRRLAFRWLLIDAFAPVLGVASTMFYSVPERFLGLVLATFCGFFLYIGASDLLPESHHRHPTFWTTCATVLGAVVIFTAVRIASF